MTIELIDNRHNHCIQRPSVVWKFSAYFLIVVSGENFKILSIEHDPGASFVTDQSRYIMKGNSQRLIDRLTLCQRLSRSTNVSLERTITICISSASRSRRATGSDVLPYWLLQPLINQLRLNRRHLWIMVSVREKYLTSVHWSVHRTNEDIQFSFRYHHQRYCKNHFLFV